MKYTQVLPFLLLSTSTLASTPSATVKGNVDKHTLSPQSVVFARVDGNTPFGMNVSSVSVVMTDTPNFCQQLASHQVGIDASRLVLIVSMFSGPIGPAIYPFPAEPSATDPRWYQVDANFGSSASPPWSYAASKGSVSLTSISGNELTGTFTGTFGADTLEAEFSAEYCQALADALR